MYEATRSYGTQQDRKYGYSLLPPRFCYSATQHDSRATCMCSVCLLVTGEFFLRAVRFLLSGLIKGRMQKLGSAAPCTASLRAPSREGGSRDANRVPAPRPCGPRVRADSRSASACR